MIAACIALAGTLAIGRQVAAVWPKQNRVIVRLPVAEVRRVSIEIRQPHGEPIRRIELFPTSTRARQVECVVDAASGDYEFDVDYEFRAPDQVDKNHGGGWTRVGVQHQIRLEGEDYRIPPPKEAP